MDQTIAFSFKEASKQYWISEVGFFCKVSYKDFIPVYLVLVKHNNFDFNYSFMSRVYENLLESKVSCFNRLINSLQNNNLNEDIVKKTLLYLELHDLLKDLESTDLLEIDSFIEEWKKKISLTEISIDDRNLDDINDLTEILLHFPLIVPSFSEKGSLQVH